MAEIAGHIKKNSDITVSGGTFYFKFDDAEKPVLLFAAQIKTERPILILNSAVNLAIVMTENKVIGIDPIPPSTAKSTTRRSDHY